MREFGVGYLATLPHSMIFSVLSPDLCLHFLGLQLFRGRYRYRKRNGFGDPVSSYTNMRADIEVVSQSTVSCARMEASNQRRGLGRRIDADSLRRLWCDRGCPCYGMASVYTDNSSPGLTKRTKQGRTHGTLP